MSFFQKALASVGIGSAKVDTILHQNILSPGGQLDGVIKIKGGNVLQKIDAIYLKVHATYEKESNDKKQTVSTVIDSFLLAKSLSINVHEEVSVPFSFKLSNDTPLTVGKTRVWVSTGLDIKNALDPKDEDLLEVKPNQLVNGLLVALEDLGFRLYQAECKAVSYSQRRRLPFIQELEYKPVSGSFYNRLDELEVMILEVHDNKVDILLQVDKKARGLAGLFAEALDMDESFVPLTITTTDLPHINQKLYAIINKYA